MVSLLALGNERVENLIQVQIVDERLDSSFLRCRPPAIGE